MVSDRVFKQAVIASIISFDNENIRIINRALPARPTAPLRLLAAAPTRRRRTGAAAEDRRGSQPRQAPRRGDFSKDEIQKRIDLCRERMKEFGFYGMLLSAESNLNYYTDYKTHAPWTTFTRLSFFFMPENGSLLLYVQIFVEPEVWTAAKCCQVKGFQNLLGPTAKNLLSRRQIGRASCRERV